MAYETIKYEVAEQILTITLNRPDKLNAFTGQMMVDMIKAFDLSDADDAVRVVIVTGAGKAFSAGGDFELIKSILDNPVARMATWKEAKDLVYNVINCNKPIISAINGVAVGAGEHHVANERCKMRNE